MDTRPCIVYAQLTARQHTAVHRLCRLTLTWIISPFPTSSGAARAFICLEDGKRMNWSRMPNGSSVEAGVGRACAVRRVCRGRCTTRRTSARAHGTALMQRLAAEIQDYGIGGLATRAVPVAGSSGAGAAGRRRLAGMGGWRAGACWPIALMILPSAAHARSVERADLGRHRLATQVSMVVLTAG